MTPNDPSVAAEVWGHLPDGRPVRRFTLTSAAGVSVQLAEYGARIVRVLAPDRAGAPGDVTLGYDEFAPYLDPAQAPYFGAVVGRFANRVAGGRFVLDGHTYRLPINNPPNSLHGGPGGFDTALWSGTPFRGPEGDGVRFSYLSPDGEEGYPGVLDVSVRYTLSDAGTLSFAVEASTTRPTPVNVSNHAYWNLADGGAGSVLGHELTLAAPFFLPVDAGLIPLGTEAEVGGTPFDFRHAKPLGRDLYADDEQLRRGGGYDHHFVLRGAEPRPDAQAGPDSLHWAATLADPASGRQMQLWTTEPGVQVYSGNMISGEGEGRGGAPYRPHSAVCLEPQHAPDSPNQPQFPDVILRPGEVFYSRSEWRFSVTGPGGQGE